MLEEVGKGDEQRTLQVAALEDLEEARLLLRDLDTNAHLLVLLLDVLLREDTLAKLAEVLTSLFRPALGLQPNGAFGDEPDTGQRDQRDQVEKAVRNAERGLSVDGAGTPADKIDDEAAGEQGKLVSGYDESTDLGGDDLGLVDRDDGELDADVDVVEDAGGHDLLAVLRRDGDGRRAEGPEAHDGDAPPAPDASADEGADEDAYRIQSSMLVFWSWRT